MDVSVVILNYNTFALTCSCIQSVMDKTSGIDYEIILVDNASTECAAQEFKTRFPQIILIENKTNTGFAKGNNTGIAHARGKYILLLNSDTELANNAIKITYDYLQQNTKAGVVSARLIFPDGRVQSACQRFPSIRYKLIELLRIHKIYSKAKAGKMLLGPFFDYNTNTTCDWVWGTYFMFRAEIIKQLPGEKLYDDFFMYGEDMQWCMDIQRLGYEIHFCAAAQVIHHMGASNANAAGMMKTNHTTIMRRNYNGLHRKGIAILDTFLKPRA